MLCCAPDPQRLASSEDKVMKDETDFPFFLILSHSASTKALRCLCFIPAFVAILLLSCSPVVGTRQSGLQPVFPGGARCPEIASPFGSETRYDGSPRPSWAPGGGTHGGIDITLDESTPLLALAAGTVVSKGEGGQMLGIYLWLRHSPEDTGLPYWVFSKYQHLQSLPELAVGAKVVVGEVIARSGKTGTVGGHFGFYGYPHLHLTARKSPTGEYQIRGSRVKARGSRPIDPLVIYHEASPKPKETVDPQAREKTVTIPYVRTNGQAWPQGTRVLWPVACRRR